MGVGSTMSGKLAYLDMTAGNTGGCETGVVELEKAGRAEELARGVGRVEVEVAGQERRRACALEDGGVLRRARESRVSCHQPSESYKTKKI